MNQDDKIKQLATLAGWEESTNITPFEYLEAYCTSNNYIIPVYIISVLLGAITGFCITYFTF